MHGGYKTPRFLKPLDQPDLAYARLATSQSTARIADNARVAASTIALSLHVGKTLEAE